MNVPPKRIKIQLKTDKGAPKKPAPEPESPAPTPAPSAPAVTDPPAEQPAETPPPPTGSAAGQSDKQQETTDAPDSHVEQYPEPQPKPKGGQTKPAVKKQSKPTRPRSAAALLHDEATADNSSLPVLDAFQDFLQHERTKARSRVAALAIFFLVLLVLILGSSLFVGKVLLDELSADYNGLRDKVAKHESAMNAAGQKVDSALSRVASTMHTVSGDMARERQALADAHAALGSTKTSQMEGFSELQKTIEGLKNENELLQKKLRNMDTRWLGLLDSIRNQPAPATEPIAAEKRAPSTMVMSIQLESGKDAVNWRMPIPE